jgi:hypothetical protein
MWENVRSELVQAAVASGSSRGFVEDKNSISISVLNGNSSVSEVRA